MDKPEEIAFAKLLFGGIALVVVLVLIIVIFMVLYQRKLFIQQANLHQLELGYQNNILESVVNSQEAERERIARDLHDEVGASLSAVKLFINQIQYENSIIDMKDLAKQSSEILGDIVSDVRRISHNLSPVTLESFGLSEATKILLKRLESTGILTSANIQFASESLDNYRQLILYRVIQEVFGNILKHAAATEVILHLRQINDTLWLHIEDNGKGFDPDSPRPGSSGMGIGTLKARSGLLNAKFDITSAIGHGTSVELIIPL
jgi:two-component system NarL family sensor kinase